MSFYPPYSHSKNKVQVELDLSNYATKSDLNIAARVDTSQFAKKYYLANLKLEADKLDNDKLETNQVDRSKLSDAIKNEVVKKTEYDNKVKKVDSIKTDDTSNLVKKAD